MSGSVARLKRRDPRTILDAHGKFLFIPNPKVAFTSITFGVLADRKITSGDVADYSAGWKKLFNSPDFLVFTFVRNPWERVLSAFKFLQTPRKHIISDKTVFKDYVKTELVNKWPAANVHFRLQDAYLYQGEPYNIFIGRFEHLDRDWAYVAERIGAPKQLPKLNSTKHAHYSEYYDDECVEIIRRLYRREIDFLGYEYKEGK